MPIVLARVDNRLVHGQILSAWGPAVDADAMLVLDDEVARNRLLKSAMEIAIPPDVRFEAEPIANTKTALERVAYAQRLMVLVRDVADATRALDAGLKIDRLNIGNVHFSSGRKLITQAVHLSPDEVTELGKIEARGVAVELKTLPNESPMPLAQIRERLEKAK